MCKRAIFEKGNKNQQQHAHFQPTSSPKSKFQKHFTNFKLVESFVPQILPKFQQRIFADYQFEL